MALKNEVYETKYESGGTKIVNNLSFADFFFQDNVIELKGVPMSRKRFCRFIDNAYT